MWIAAADLVVSSAGNSTCAQVAAAGVPWIVVPEWRYFDEQVEKARALSRLGAAHHLAHLPSSAQAWRRAVAAATEAHDPAAQRILTDPAPAQGTARWIEDLIARLWTEPALTTETERTIA